MSASVVRLRVPPEVDGVRLDRFLAERIPEHSRSALRRLVDLGRVTVDGLAAGKPGLALRPGSEIRVDFPEPPPDRPGPEPIPVAVVLEDDDLAIVVKPAGLVVHPGHGRRTGTLVNALLGRGMALAPAGGAERPGIVHRLDRETSGLVIVAKTDRAHRALVAAFARRAIRKTYRAVVWGALDPPAGTIDRGIGRSRSDRTRMSVRAPRRRPATTVYRTVERFPLASLLDIDLVTGRTHQIRVHMTALGHPVVGDTRYGRGPGYEIRSPELRAALRGFRRLALHASDVAFDHPINGRPIVAHAPLPDDVATLVDLFRTAA